MGLFKNLFKNRPAPVGKYKGGFKMLDGHTPRFTKYEGGLYEQELIRAAIHARATHVSKLSVNFSGSARPALQSKLRKAPNQFQTWSKFLYRASTLLDVYNTVFITPVYDEYGEPSGIYTPLPERCEIVRYGDTPYLRYKFAWGDVAAIELAYCGIMTKFQCSNDFLGENNKAMLPTLNLLHIQQQGIEEGVKSAATFRFFAQMDNWSSPEDIANERKRFSEYNFSREGGGLLLFPNTYKNIQQVTAKPFVVDAEQTKIIKDSIYEYFGVNEDILQNKAYGDAWAAFYEGAIEPFAIQFSEVVTKMLFTLREQAQGNAVYATANRLKYLSTADKANVTQIWADHGLAMVDEIREVWDLPALPDDIGKAIPIRGEFYDMRTGEKISVMDEEEQSSE